MPFISPTYLASFQSGGERATFLMRHTTLGYHPDTHEDLMISETDRRAGMYVLGKPGYGKTSFLNNLIDQDAAAGHAVIVIDPHGDLTKDCLAQLPPFCVAKTYVLDMEDEAYPFGINLFAVGSITTEWEKEQAVERVLHIFKVLWPEVWSQQNLPRYLRMATIALLVNRGATLVDMYQFLLDDKYRGLLLSHVQDASVLQFWKTQFEDLSAAERRRVVQPLLGRLESLFAGRSLVKNIVGQRKTSIDFRKAIENHEIIFVRLPVNAMEQNAYLIGTLVIAQVSAALFSFVDTPQDKRPGVSLYVDEFQNFTTPDFSKLFTEARKYGARLTLAHQYRGQLPDFLQDSTMTARTIICFRTTPEDGTKMAPVFYEPSNAIRPEDIDPHPAEFLLAHGSTNHYVEEFIQYYLRPLKTRWGTTRPVEIRNTGVNVKQDLINIAFALMTPREMYEHPSKTPPKVDNPTLALNALLRDVMKHGSPNVPIPYQAVWGFSDTGRHSFFHELKKHAHLLDGPIHYPPHLVIFSREGAVWTREPDSGLEQLYHFLFLLTRTMIHLAAEPIGTPSTTKPTDIAHILTRLPPRAALVRAGDTVGTIWTKNTPPMASGEVLRERLSRIQQQTRDKYCHPRDAVEAHIAGAGLMPNQPAPSSNQPSQGTMYQRLSGNNSASPPPSRWERIDP